MGINIQNITFKPEQKVKKSLPFNGYESPKLKLLPQIKQDTVSFTAKKDLIKKYGINLDEMQVITRNAPQVGNAEAKVLLEKVLEAHEQAAKNKELGNYSGRCYSSNINFDNGQWAVATNIENSPDVVLCGERSALVRVWNQTLQSLSLDKLRKDEAYLEAARKGLKVNYLAMSSFNYPGEDVGAGNPCSDCLSWLNLEKYFKHDTKIVTFERDPQTRQPKLIIRGIKEVLPHWGAQLESVTDKPIDSLPVNISQRAKQSMEKHGITQQKLQELVEEAKQAQAAGVTSELSDKNVGTAALLTPGEMIIKGDRMDWTRRWNIPPDEMAAASGFQFLKQLQQKAARGVDILNEVGPWNAKNDGFIERFAKHADEEVAVKAVAYYGADKVPYLASLGRISQGRGAADTLIAVIRNDKIEIETILDYMPYLYISSKKK